MPCPLYHHITSLTITPTTTTTTSPPSLPPLRPQNGLLLGLPIILDTDSEDLVVGDKVLLTYQGQNIGTVTIDSKWTPNKPLECLKCYGTSSLEHPAVQMVAMERGKYYIGEWRARRVSVQQK